MFYTMKQKTKFENKERKKVLITGGLGFIGSNIAKKCIELGYDVTILSKSKTKIKNIEDIKNKIKFVKKDINDINLEVKNKDYIFHCASTSDNYNIKDNPCDILPRINSWASTGNFPIVS